VCAKSQLIITQLGYVTTTPQVYEVATYKINAANCWKSSTGLQQIKKQLRYLVSQHQNDGIYQQHVTYAPQSV